MKNAKGRTPAVVDTNVPVVANHQHHESLACANACAQALHKIKESGNLVIDDKDRLLAEYRSNLSMKGQPGIGDAFVKWVHDNAGRIDLVTRVRITPVGNAGDFKEFPRNPDLKGFDISDRKFVAVALSHPQVPHILNASDSDWWIHNMALQAEGITVEFLCPELFSDI